MQVRFKGWSTLNGKIGTQNYIKAYIEFCLFTLKISTPTYKKLILNLKFNDKLKREEKSLGDCIWTNTPHRPREFDMNIDSSFGRVSILQCISHELVHLHQYATNRVYDLILTGKRSDFPKSRQHLIHESVNDTCIIDTRWDGMYYATEGSKLHYYETPWEIDAHGKERGLYQRWMQLQTEG